MLRSIKHKQPWHAEWLRIWSVPEGMGGVHKTCGNSGGVGVFFVFKKWKFQGGGGDLREIPSTVGVWIFSGTTR